MGKIKNLKLLLLATFIVTFFMLASIANASFLDDLFGRSDKKPALGTSQKNLSIESAIKLAPGGDQNQNGVIDGGDIVTFSFKITNGTDKKYPFSKIKSNIKRDDINFIHNVTGVTGIENSTLDMPNIFIPPHSQLSISFEARINYFDEGEKEIASSGELNDEKGQKLAQSIKSALKAKANKNGSSSMLQSQSNGKQEPKTEEIATPNPSPSGLTGLDELLNAENKAATSAGEATASGEKSSD